MKLEKILDNLNSFEKNSFLKILDNIITNSPKNIKEVDKILNDPNRDLKNIDNINIAKVFNHIEEEFTEYIKMEFVNTTSQFDILTDIISRDGNCIMKQDWFARLYEKELNSLDKKLKKFQKTIENGKIDIDESRKRDYFIYKACLYTAYNNDLENNQENKITSDELSILLTLSQKLGLSQEEIKLINYLIIPIEKKSIDSVINDLRILGVVFYSKKTNTVYVADEVVKVLRKIRGKEVADKFFRRTLRLLKESQINLICRKHNIDWKQSHEEKIRDIINAGLSFSDVLANEIHRNGASLTDKKKVVTELCNKGLKISPPLKGATLEDKISNLIKYFENVEKDEKVSISINGYEKLLREVGEMIPELNFQVKNVFELQEEKVLVSHYLLDLNIKPRDILEIVPESELEKFSKLMEIKTRGDIINNILDAYKDAENLYLENYENIGFRDLHQLKDNGILIKESELGIKFEDLTKIIFKRLGFNVDEKLRKKLNTSKDKIDIVLNLGNNDLIIIECKTIKESGYNKFSSVSRQIKSYTKLAERKEYKVVKALLIAPDFSDDFINDCGLDYEINLSLIKASTLLNILDGFKKTKHKQFPHNLLLKDVLIQEERILKAIGK